MSRFMVMLVYTQTCEFLIKTSLTIITTLKVGLCENIRKTYPLRSGEPRNFNMGVQTYNKAKVGEQKFA